MQRDTDSLTGTVHAIDELYGARKDLILTDNNVVASLRFKDITVSWQMSMPRSASRSSTFLSDRGKRTYISTTRRITSAEELKRRKGLGGIAQDFARHRLLIACLAIFAVLV